MAMTIAYYLQLSAPTTYIEPTVPEPSKIIQIQVDETGGRLKYMIRLIISGGQTGVDRAGLDAAIKAGFPVGGYCPKGRLSEDGPIPDFYPLQELSLSDYAVSTEKNVVESDGTLIINKGDLSLCNKLTSDYAIKHMRPCLIVPLEEPTEAAHVIRWIVGQQITTLNIAGPRESKCPDGIYTETIAYLDKLFSLLKET